jgi:hypothetical protein
MPLRASLMQPLHLGPSLYCLYLGDMILFTVFFCV